VAWRPFVDELPTPPQKGGSQSSHQRTSIHVQAVVKIHFDRIAVLWMSVERSVGHIVAPGWHAAPEQPARPSAVSNRVNRRVWPRCDRFPISHAPMCQTAIKAWGCQRRARTRRHTSPSPVATATCGSRSTVPLSRRSLARRFGLRGRSAQYRGRTRLCVGWTGLWSGSPQRGGLSDPISAQAFMCRLMSSGFEPIRLPISTGYVRGFARHAAWLRFAILTGDIGGPTASDSVAGGRVRRSPGGYACQLTTAALALPLMESNLRDSSVQPKIHRLRVPHHRWPTPSGVPRRRLSPLHPQTDERKPEFKLERSR